MSIGDDIHGRRRRLPVGAGAGRIGVPARRSVSPVVSGTGVYDPERTPRQASLLCRDIGMTDSILASFFGVSEGTVRVWKLKHPEFAAAVRRGKDEFDSERVESSLMRRALGSEGELRVTKRITEDTPNGTIVKETEEVVAGDTAAAKLWLQNRRRERWTGDGDVTESRIKEKVAPDAAGASQVLGILLAIGAIPRGIQSIAPDIIDCEAAEARDDDEDVRSRGGVAYSPVPRRGEEAAHTEDDIECDDPSRYDERGY